MTPDYYADQAAALCDVCHLFGSRRWCLATSGNFSVRIGPAHYLITQSGKDKSLLTQSDLMICGTNGQATDESFQPSAESALHAWLYRSDPANCAVLHTHSVFSTVVSRAAGSAVEIEGFEMQKALQGVASHDTTIVIPVLDNSQDMSELVAQLESSLAAFVSPPPGFLIRGHGLYAWGGTLVEAQRHVEGLEFLLECAWQEMRR